MKQGTYPLLSGLQKVCIERMLYTFHVCKVTHKEIYTF